LTILRPYQIEARDNVFRDWAAGLRRLALVLPTGAGKTVVFSEIIRHFREVVGPYPVLVLAHREELLSQAAEKIQLWAPDLRVGIVKAARNQVHHPVIVASQQTLVRESRVARLPRFGLVIVDECHRSMGTSYLALLERLGCLAPDGPYTLGVTATFTREDSKRLTDFYQAVPFSLDIVDLILPDPVTGMSYLAPPKFKRVLIEGLDLSGIPMSRLAGGKDLAAADLGEAMDRAGAPGVVAAAYAKHAGDRAGMVFTPTVASAEHVAEAFRQIGITAVMLSGKTSARDRRRALADYAEGKIQVITNAALLGEGVDAPRTSCIVIARPTMSKTLFRQMVGRGLRLHPGKTDCLVLDVVGATGRNDLRTLNDVTDLAIEAQEGETIDQAARRAIAESGPREPTADGDGLVSGSLIAVDIDPWEIERNRGRPRRATGEPLSDEELAEQARQRELERQRKEEERELKLKRRYKHVPMRRGWFLHTIKGRWFIHLETQAKQEGFVVVAEQDDGTFVVGLELTGVTTKILETFSDDADATRYAIDLTLGIVEQAMERFQVDPDAHWRRKPASEGQIEYAESLTANVDFEEYHYRGQVSDFITWAKWHRKVDKFADEITAGAKDSARLFLAR